jgi:hypothetical protein
MKCDTKDRHVLAAAARNSANQIVTMILRDFPDHALEPYGIEAAPPVQVQQWCFGPTTRGYLAYLEQCSGVTGGLRT